MLIDQSFRNSVAFVMMDLPQKDGTVKRKPAGTAFLLDYEEGGLTFFYAVTARHVLDEGQRMGASGLFLRMRGFDEDCLVARGYTDVQTTVDQWVRHPETDVAVARIGMPDGTIFGTHSVRMMLGPPEPASPYGNAPIGEGDDVFFVGLFSRFYGEESILPIVRFGNIALMPYEPIGVKLSKAPDAPTVPIEAYLVEARSWGGHSGSPAWAYFPLTRDPSKGLRWEDLGATTPKLLGLVHGHYSIEKDADFIGDSDQTRSLAANAGIAVIVPAHKIMEVIDDDKLAKERAEKIERVRANLPTPEPDTALDEDNLSEFERFEDLTRKLAQTPKSEVDEKRRGD